MNSEKSSGRTARLAMSLLLGAFLPVCSGCGPSFGAFLYMSGLVPAQKVAPEFTLPQGPLLILVDDDQDLVQPPLAKQMLIDSLAKLLREHKIADRVTTNEELARVRQTDEKFDQRGAREVGRQVGADTVLWISIRQFALDNDLEMTVTPATFAASVKVVNAKAEKRDDVRLWPLDREGKLMQISVAAQDLHKIKIRQDIYQKMADELADSIAKLFYEYEAPE